MVTSTFASMNTFARVCVQLSRMYVSVNCILCGYRLKYLFFVRLVLAPTVLTARHETRSVSITSIMALREDFLAWNFLVRVSSQRKSYLTVFGSGPLTQKMNLRYRVDFRRQELA